ncbi:hypothetical protein C8R41DRAFT_253238 [Lentinula lateritia]|uniref:Uncharacterized protein n=1 Tax=Lentinula lateritia TaxID=40482 RepID=A0ABQ8VJT4_9AGAR|nr:hypothetical protein C8R41DRAFT_253238 [Lentinula lateritia]
MGFRTSFKRERSNYPQSELHFLCLADFTGMFCLEIIHSLHIQSTLLLHSPTPAWISTYPSPAASRVEHSPFISLIQAGWNEQLEKAFVGVGQADKHVSNAVGEFRNWAGRKLARKD